MTLTISKITQRRFILGKQGLYPGRRWRGKDGVRQAINSGSIVQIDPLNMVARSHEIVLYGRVLDYTPAHLDSLLYQDREAFDWGGTVLIHPMSELPYWRVVMARKQNQKRHTTFAEQHPDVIQQVLDEIRSRGPLSTRDFKGNVVKTGNFRSGKDTGQALYYLWIAGELMTHSRRGFDRIYDLRERIAPAKFNYAASPDETDDYFSRTILRDVGITNARGWRSWFAGTIERPVDVSEATARLDALLKSAEITEIRIEGDTKTPRYIDSKDLPLLETLHADNIPDEWQPLETTTSQEMIFLAPLEIVSARGRAMPLFGFEYLWEVYKPAEKRRWGYYVLPILYGDTLVARFDSKLERASKILVVKGFWLEEGVKVDTAFIHALAAGFKRFLRFIGAESIDLSSIGDMVIKEGLSGLLTS